MTMKNGDMPAMPCEQIIDVTNSMGHGTRKVSYTGLTKREQFAAMAMQGYVMDDAIIDASETAQDWYDQVAEAAVKQADALLKALEESK